MKHRIAILKGANVSALTKIDQYAKLEIFPNPSQDYIAIEHLKLHGAKYQILSLIGHTVQTGNLDKNKLFIGHLAQGSYALRIYSRTKGYFGIFTKI